MNTHSFFIYPFRHTCWLDSGYRTNKQWTVERPHTAALSVINRLNILKGKQTNSEMIQSLLTFEWRRERGKAPELVLSLALPLRTLIHLFLKHEKKNFSNEFIWKWKIWHKSFTYKLKHAPHMLHDLLFLFAFFPTQKYRVSGWMRRRRGMLFGTRVWVRWHFSGTHTAFFSFSPVLWI